MSRNSHSLNIPVYLIAAVGALLFLLTICTSCYLSPDLEVSRIFQKAQEHYDNAASKDDYLEAATLYQQIIDSGFISGVVYYNMGNAFMQADKHGLALAAYRQAEQYDPRDPYVKSSIENAFGENSPIVKSKTVMDHLLFWKDWLSYPEKFYLTTLFASLSLIFALAALFYRNTRSLWRRLMYAAMIVTAVLAVSAAYDWNRFDRVRHGVVILDNTVARKGASDNFNQAFTNTLKETTEFQLIDARGAWIKIRLHNSLEGWIPSDSATTY